MRVHETATREDILRRIVIYKSKYEISLKNFTCFVTDGAPVIMVLKIALRKNEWIDW